MNIIRKAIGACLLILLSSACSKNEMTTFTLKDVSIKAEGPLFEGSNTIQGEISNQLKAFAQAHQFSVDDLAAAKLKSVTIKQSDSSVFDLFTSVKLQMVSEKSSMIDLGVINPIVAGQKEIKLNVAGDQSNLLELLKEEKFTIVADVNMNKDYDGNVNWICQFEFELSYKK